MNNFREWLSDNLRYIMLGFFILVILVAIFFGIRFLSSHFSDDSDTTNKTAAETPSPTETPVPTATPTETPTPTPTVSDALQQNAVPTVTALVTNYYNAIAAKDVNTLRGLVDTLSAEDEAY